MKRYSNTLVALEELVNCILRDSWRTTLYHYLVQVQFPLQDSIYNHLECKTICRHNSWQYCTEGMLESPVNCILRALHSIGEALIGKKKCSSIMATSLDIRKCPSFTPCKQENNQMGKFFLNTAKYCKNDIFSTFSGFAPTKIAALT